MKLIKKSRSKNQKDQCCAVTNSGKRCKRSIYKNDLCKQHFSMQQILQKKMTDYPGHVLDELPKAPPTLKGIYKDRWRQVCESLHYYNQLRGIYLVEIYHMIQLEMLLDDIMESVKDKDYDGYLNEYVTESGHEGNNINGLWVLKRDTEKELSDIKKRLHLTPDAVPKLIKTKDLLMKVKQDDAPLRKVKSWT